MNVELLRQVEAHILAEPKRLHMRTWIVRQRHVHKLVNQNGDSRDYARCGTAACIAGWAVLIVHEPPGAPEFDPAETNPSTGMANWDVYNEAKSLLSLERRQADRLFDPINWPVAFAAGARDDGSKATAEAAVRRIEHFISTEGRE